MSGFTDATTAPPGTTAASGNSSWRSGRRTLPHRAPRTRLRFALALLQPLADLDRGVGEHAIGAGALEGEQGLHHHPVAVEPAIGVGGLDHRVFAGDLIGEGRHAEGLLDASYEVEIGQTRLQDRKSVV